MALDWLDGPKDCNQPILIILHGLTGDSNDSHIKHAVLRAEKIGLRPVVFHNRGCGGTILKTPRAYSAAQTSDLKDAIDHIQSCFPGAKLLAMGVSLGSMILVKLVMCFGLFSATCNTLADLYLRMLSGCTADQVPGRDKRRLPPAWSCGC